MTDRSWGLWLFVAAAAVRLLYLSAGVEVPIQDTADYDDIAHSLLDGAGFVARDNWFGYPLYSWRAPAYPFFLAGIYGLFGPGHLAVQIAQALIGAGTVVLVFRLALRLCAAAAPLAGIAAVLYPPLVASASEVMTETLYTACFVAAVWAAIEARERASRGWSLATGCLVGLTAMTRPVGLLVWPAVLVVAAWEERRAAGGRRRWLLFAAAVTAGTVVVLLPWTARNAIVHGEFVPLSTHGGFIVARSNADTPDWRQPQGWRIDRELLEGVPDEVERDRRWWRQGLSWIGGHPLGYLQLSVERFLRFWYVFRPDYNAAFVFVAPFFVFGLVRFGLQPGFRYATGVCGLSLAVFCLLLYGSTRFRLPMEPIFLVYGAAAAVEGYHRLGRHRLAMVALGWSAVQALIWWQQESVRALVVELLTALGWK